MTEPFPRVPIPPTPVDWPSVPRWCRVCEIHMATNHKPLCPSCLDGSMTAPYPQL
jgi:hypothetical protein